MLGTRGLTPTARDQMIFQPPSAEYQAATGARDLI